MTHFEVSQSAQLVLLRTAALELGWSREDGALRILRRPGRTSAIGRGPAPPGLDVAVGGPGAWLARFSFVRYLNHRVEEVDGAAEMTIFVGLGPLKIADRYRVIGSMVRRTMLIENVSPDDVEIYGVRLWIGAARLEPAERCRFDAPGNSVRPRIALEVATNQRRNVLPRRFFAPGVRGNSAFELSPIQSPGLMALHVPDESLLCWYYSGSEAALPFIEGGPPGDDGVRNVSLAHEVGLAGRLAEGTVLPGGTQYLLISGEPWEPALKRWHTIASAISHAHDTPTDWVRDGVFYETHPGLHGGYAGLTAALGRLHSIGITVLALLPVWEFAGLRNRLWDGNWVDSGNPYAIRDFDHLDYTLGSPDELHHLTSRAHDLGIRVILDLPVQGCAIGSRYAVEHPDWFARDSNGAFINSPQAIGPQVGITLPQNCHYFDWGNSELRNYLHQVALTMARTYDLDGFRVIAPYSPALNWSRRAATHASGASMGLLDMLHRLREEMRLAHPEAALITNLGGPAYTGCHDGCYDYLAHHMFIHLALNRIFPEELGTYLRDHRAATIGACARISFVEAHNTYEVDPLADGLRGSRISRMLLAGLMLCGFTPSLWHGQEVGEEEGLRRLITLWHEQPALRRGSVLFDAVRCDTPQVFAVARVIEDTEEEPGCVIGLLNVGPEKRTVTVTLLMESLQLGERSYTLHDLLGHTAPDDDDEVIYQGDDLLRLRLALEPFSASCFALKPAEVCETGQSAVQ